MLSNSAVLLSRITVSFKQFPENNDSHNSWEKYKPLQNMCQNVHLKVFLKEHSSRVLWSHLAHF